MNSTDRAIAILGLFNLERRIWTAEAIASHFGVSTSQAYRYCKSLVTAGLLDPLMPAGYTLGPGILELERLVQMSDPLISAARPVMRELVPHAPAGATILVAKLYRSKVICLDQVLGPGPQTLISFERGRPMPLLWGATSKAILAQMTSRDLMRIYRTEEDAAKVAVKAKPTLSALRSELADIRQQGFSIAYGEIDRERIAVATPILVADKTVIGSLTIAVSKEAGDQRTVRRLAALLKASSAEIEFDLADQMRVEAGKTIESSNGGRGARAAPTQECIADATGAYNFDIFRIIRDKRSQI